MVVVLIVVIRAVYSIHSQKNTFIIYNNWKFNYDKDDVLHSAFEAIEKQLGGFPTPNDYLLHETSEYDEPQF